MVMMLDTATTGSDASRPLWRGILASIGFTNVETDLTAEPFHGRTDSWFPQPGVRIHRHVGSPHRIWNTTSELRRESRPDRLTFGLRMGGHGSIDTPQAAQKLHGGDLYLVDQTSAMDYRSATDGGTLIFAVDTDRMAVSPDTVRKAITALRTSPVYDLFRLHLAALDRDLDRIPDGAPQELLASATIDIARSLIATAVHDGAPARAAMHDSAHVRVAAYVQQHLTDPDLSARSIARGTHMSLRQVYKVWEPQEHTLAQFIITARLEGVRHDLARPDLNHVPIAQIAARWGFGNAAHFSRRFHAAYEVTPREWRRAGSAPETGR